MTQITMTSGKALTGACSVPGDKSISHRAVLFGGIAEGDTHVRNFLDGGDYRTGLRLLSRRHDVVPVVISDPTERSGRSMGLAEFVDMETGRRVLTETFPSAVPAPDLKGFETIELGTDLPAGGAVLDFLRKRGRARRPGRGPE